MTIEILDPPREEIRRWGVLAYVSPAERTRIMALPAGQAKFHIRALEREVAERKKRRGGHT